MPTDLEQRFRSALQEVALEFPPPADLRQRVAGRAARHVERRRLLALAASMILAVGIAGALNRVRDQRLAAGPGPDRPRVIAGTGPGGTDAHWIGAVDPVLAWTFEHPDSWTVQPFSNRCKVSASGSVVTNLDRPLRFPDTSNVCTTSWDLADVPADFVGVQMQHRAGGRPTSFPPPAPETAFPLSLVQAGPPAADRSGDPPAIHIPISFNGENRYIVSVWIGTDASADDRQTVARIVASIRPGSPSADPAKAASAPLGDPDAIARCEATAPETADGTPATAAGGYNSTQRAVAAWIDARSKPDGPSIDPEDGAPATLCFLDGFFAYPHPPPGPDIPPTTLDTQGRAVVLIKADGTRIPLFVGPAEGIAVERPAAG